jgi:hypothetical protein
MSPSGFPFTGITLLGNAATDLLKLQDLEQFSFSDAWAHFLSSEGAVFSSRLIASDFPVEPLKQMFPEPGHGSYRLPDGLEKTLERVRVLAYTQDDGSDYVTMSEDKGNLKIKGERQFGSIKEKIKLKVNEWPEGVIINIQPGHLLDIMSKTRNFQMVDKLAYFHGPGFNTLSPPSSRIKLWDFFRTSSTKIPVAKTWILLPNPGRSGKNLLPSLEKSPRRFWLIIVRTELLI